MKKGVLRIFLNLFGFKIKTYKVVFSTTKDLNDAEMMKQTEKEISTNLRKFAINNGMANFEIYENNGYKHCSCKIMFLNN